MWSLAHPLHPPTRITPTRPRRFARPGNPPSWSQGLPTTRPPGPRQCLSVKPKSLKSLEKPGKAWKSRYESCCLQAPGWGPGTSTIPWLSGGEVEGREPILGNVVKYANIVKWANIVNWANIGKYCELSQYGEFSRYWEILWMEAILWDVWKSGNVRQHCDV